MPSEYRLLTAVRSSAHTSTAAIAIIDLQGDLETLTTALGLSPLPAPGELRLCRIPRIDEVLLCRINQHYAQLHTHAGPVVLSRLITALQEAGCRPSVTEPETPDALLNHWLAWAPSPLALDLLLAQPRIRAEQPPPPAADPRLNRLLHPPLVAAVGHPNVGKSSLLNALARRSVAIVSELPGTTRDPVGAYLDLAGLVVRWIDLPGLRATDDPIEAEAIRRAHQWASRADLVLLCSDHDAHALPPIPKLGPDTIRLTVRTKSDTAPAPTPETDIACSAHTGRGLSDLAEAVAESLVPRAIRNPESLWHLPSP